MSRVVAVSLKNSVSDRPWSTCWVGKIGRVYYPAPFMTNENLEYYQDAYEIGYEKVIDTYAAAHLPQADVIDRLDALAPRVDLRLVDVTRRGGVLEEQRQRQALVAPI
jgi:hypothetical protein